MKTSSALLLACALAIPSFAQNATSTATSTATPQSASNQMTLLFLALPVSSAMVSAPMVLTNGIISQPEQTELAGGGNPVFNFTITQAGNYVVQAVVNAPGEDSNSFYVNVDAQPEARP